MSKTIKVIDLLNKIANGEEVPEKMLYKEKIFEFDKLEKCYITSNFDNTVMNDLGIYLDDGLKMNSLNDTVEIIEEQEKIDIQSIEELDENFTYIENHSSGLGIEKVLNKAEIELVNKINKLVQAVKQLDKKIKEKE